MKRFLLLVPALCVLASCNRPRPIRPDGDAITTSCSTDGQCPNGTCQNGSCVPTPDCELDSECPGGTCVSGMCVLNGDADTLGRECVTDEGCDDGEFCHYRSGGGETTGNCSELCTIAADCFVGQSCAGGRCYTLDVCSQSNDCVPGELCNPVTNRCGPAPPTQVDWCRLDRPASAFVAAGDGLEVFGRVRLDGVTNQTPGTDAPPDFVAQVGFGPLDSEPNGAWLWFQAEPNLAWVDNGAPGEDEWTGIIIAPQAVGTEHSYAYRFAIDGGSLWVYCDIDLGIDGSDGSENGYQADLAGVMTVIDDPCDPDPCDTAPDDDCDGTTLRIYTSDVGTCAAVAGQPVCTYPFTEVECGSVGATCVAADCVGGPGRPATAGDVIITEYMARSQSGVDNGEWIEVHNPSGSNYDLRGCTLEDDVNDLHNITSFFPLAAGATKVMAKNADPALNHGLPGVSYVYADFDLSNSNDDAIIIRCDGIVIDQVTIPAGTPVTGVAASLDPGSYNSIANDSVLNFCDAQNGYGSSGKLGSPGLTNPGCPPRDTEIDTCRIFEPVTTTVVEAQDFTVRGRVLNLGTTDLSDAVDFHPGLVAQAGYGPVDDDPSVDDSAWTWFSGAANPAWDASVANAADFDEYLTTYAAPALGTYHHAYRFSLDGAATWTYCDRDPVDPLYEITEAAELTTLANPCLGDPCPALAQCEPDGVTTLAAPAAACTIDGTNAECDYQPELFDCSTLGAGSSCSSGLCVGNYRTPGAGELLFTEIAHTPPVGLAASDTQWIELANPTVDNLLVFGCVLGAAAGDSLLDPWVVPAGGFAVLARSATNNGLAGFDATFGGDLSAADALTLTCGATVIDAVAWDDGVLFPGAAPVAMSLDPGSFDGTDNDAGANWCLSLVTAPSGPHWGTPGAANPACAAGVDRCRLDWAGDLVNVEQGTPVSVAAIAEEAGLTDLTTGPDAHPALSGQAGYGPDGSLPAGNPAWSFVDMPVDPAWLAPVSPDPDESSDGYAGPVPAPSPGMYDVAARFSLDGGRDWLYCDQDEGAYQAGASGGITTIPSQGDNLLIDEYVEGTSSNKGLELRNGGGADIDLGTCTVEVYFNGNTSPFSNVTLDSVTLSAGDTFTVCHTGLTGSVACDQANNNISFNGNDAVVVTCGGLTMDSLGRVGDDPGSPGWGVPPTATTDQTLRRKCSVGIGDRVPNDAFDPAVEWDGFPVDTFTRYGVAECP